MFPYTIRPVQPEKDAPGIAALVKLCFGPWLDLENVDYLNTLRKEGLYANEHPLLTKLTSFPFDLAGVVCTDKDGSLLGLINTYYFYLNGRACCLIANVCVDPSHRREGIASELLKEVSRMQPEKGIQDIFLQARLERPETIEFYRKRGFRVTDYRETWIRPVSKQTERSVPVFRAESVPAADMALFRRLFLARFPKTILWNLNYKSSLFQPGLMTDILNRIGNRPNRFFRMTGRDGQVKAWAAYQKLSGSADRLWEIPAENLSDAEYAQVLKDLGPVYKGKKPVKIDVPAGTRRDVYQDAGFKYMQTLAWMWKRL